MSGAPTDPVVLAPDSSPGADTHAPKRPRTDEGSASAAPAPVSITRPEGYVPPDSIVKIKAARLARIFSNFTEEQCIEVLHQVNYDLGEAIERLRPQVPVAPPPMPTPVVPVVPVHQMHFAPAPAPVVPQQAKRPPKRRQRVVDSDSEGEASFDGASSDEEDYGDQDEHYGKQELSALQWFNQCDETRLIDSINCTPEQAAKVVSLQPFASVSDVYERLGDKANKGVTPRLFTSCVELMAGYMEVDAVLARCEAVGAQLDKAMAGWGDGAGKQPGNLADGVVLKDYQVLGVSWLDLLYSNDTSCILADEMGLGKTAQVIAFLALLKERQAARGTHLVVVPSSVLENWSREFKHFCPELAVEVYYGSQAERRMLRADLKSRNNYDVLLTTYDMATGGHDDHTFLRKHGFDACVFDEGHMLKNRKSQKYAKLLRISARWRLLLTGTPLQNNLQELVSLLNFILPDFFTDAEEALGAIFKVRQGAGTSQLSQQRVERAKRMMRPFVLRRRKDQVLRGLTEKTERVEYCDMTPAQESLYNDVLSRTREALVNDAPSKGRDTTNVLMDLRKAANHALLFRRIYDDKRIAALARDYIREPEHAEENIAHLREDFAINTDAELSLLARSWPSTRKHQLPPEEWMNSGKVLALKRIIEEVRAKGDRMLIFSQFTSVLDILCVCLELMEVPYVGFTGQTNVSDRQVLVDQFTADPSIPVFLLSTRAGGLGINLVAANWVVLFDQDFNPQNDKQATDRCYRIGQTKPVTVVKLVTRNSIDEDILALASHKLELAERVSGEHERDEGDDEQAAQAAESAIKGRLAQSLLAQVRGRAGTQQ
ncbi:DNA helicase [Malassezia cuniculi]|uniref:DNA helicase n=1 Tax=Malassezia cuniculi TaxID=948313 RepID=A0AAF0ETC2_9BASI|nr:DNA helicase [Malassezia cuniculi]